MECYGWYIMSRVKRFRVDPPVPVDLWPGYQFMRIDGRPCIVDFLSEDKRKKCIYYPDVGHMTLFTGCLDPGDVIESNLTGALADYARQRLPIKDLTGIIPSSKGGFIYVDGKHIFTVTDDVFRMFETYKAEEITIKNKGLTVTLSWNTGVLTASVSNDEGTYNIQPDDYQNFLERQHGALYKILQS